MEDAAPRIVIDREYRGWSRGPDGLYYKSSSEAGMPLERVMARNAPLRRLGEPSAQDVTLALSALSIAGKHAVASTVAATAQAASELEAVLRYRGLADPGERAVAAMNAAAPLGRRAELLTQCIALGERICFLPHVVCAYTRDLLADLIVEWIVGPGPFVDIAATLGRLIRTQMKSGATGTWEDVADAWLAVDVPHTRDAALCYELLCGSTPGSGVDSVASEPCAASLV